MTLDDPSWWGVNPAERLRAVTRRGPDDEQLPVETAGALLGFAAEPAHLVVACRRVLAHHRASGPLWWTCARILAAPEPAAACREVARLLGGDRTAERISATLPILDADEVVAVVGWPAAFDRALCERPDVAAVAVRVPGDDTTRRVRAREAPQPVRVVAPHELDGRVVARVLVPALAIGPAAALVAAGVGAVFDHLARVHPGAESWLVGGVGTVLPGRLFDAAVAANDEASVELVSLERADRVIGPRGLERSADAATHVDCPVAPELLRAL